jgi:hypothetical protein
MSMTDTVHTSSTFMRRALLADAVLSGATGLLMIAGAEVLSGLLDLPTILLRAAGLVLVPYVAFVLYAATRAEIVRSAVAAIIVVNLAWTAASIGLLFTGFVSPNVLGTAFVVFQAAVVGVLAEVQYVALRR